MFNALEPKDTLKIIDAIVPKQKKAGDTIIKQGEEGDKFYVLKDGSTEAYIEDGTVVKKFSRGDYFGEFALLTGEPRKASVRAASTPEFPPPWPAGPACHESVRQPRRDHRQTHALHQAQELRQLARGHQPPVAPSHATQRPSQLLHLPQLLLRQEAGPGK